MSHVTPEGGGHHVTTSPNRWITPEPDTGPRREGGGHWTPEEQHAAWKRVHPKWSSTIEKRGTVTFPSTIGVRVYMQPFLMDEDGDVLLPKRLAKWVPTVQDMLAGVGRPNVTMYLMIDQSVVKAGHIHRRPGAHIDGLWKAEGGGTVEADFEAKERFEAEVILLASNVAGCVAYTGTYQAADLKAGGDASGLDLSKLKRVSLKAGFVYAATAATIHESVPVKTDCQRTLVRINIPASP